MDIAKIIQAIQYVVAPAIMISSSALLLLGFQNKFSALASRFRILNQEQNKLQGAISRSPAEESRLINLKGQVQYSYDRVTLVKNSILMTYGGIFFFTATSLLILAQIFTSLDLHVFIILFFGAGFLMLLGAVGVMMKDVNLFHRVMTLEKNMGAAGNAAA